MIIGVLEYGEIRIYESIADALSEWGSFPRDLLSDVIVFYDQDGEYLEPVVHYAPKRWFEFKPKMSSVELQRGALDNSRLDALGYLLKYEAMKLAPNPFVRSLEQLRSLYPWEE